MSDPEARASQNLRPSRSLKRVGSGLRNSLRFTGKLGRRRARVRVQPSGPSRGGGYPQKGRSTQFQGSFTDVTKGSPRNSPLALLQKSPVSALGYLSMRREKGFKFMPGGWDRFYAELRGSHVLLYSETYARNMETIENQDLDANLVGIFSVAGCTMTKKAKDTIKLKRDGISVVVKFDSDQAASQWFQALTPVTVEGSTRVADFEIIAAIGKGAGGKVFLVKDKRTGERLALKSIAKEKILQSGSAFRHGVDERLLMEMTAQHPFFVQLRYAFQTRDFYYLVTEFCEGGDLYYYMYSHQSGLSEKEACIVCAEVLVALEYLHKLGFIYRDLKPENILLDAKGHVRLADFGLCKHFPSGTKLARTSTICGTHAYVAPEMLSAKYGRSVDSWAIGVFLYHIVVGRPPFEAKNLDEVEQNLKKDQDIVFYDEIMSDGIRSFITSLLERDPTKRLGSRDKGLAELRDHEFLKDIQWDKLEQRQQHEDGLIIPAGDADLYGNLQDEELLRNFDLTEWGHVSVDEDFDDSQYGKMWPPIFLEDMWRIDSTCLVGFEYSMARKTTKGSTKGATKTSTRGSTKMSGKVS